MYTLQNGFTDDALRLLVSKQKFALIWKVITNEYFIISLGMSKL